ncbi:MAG: hypothetical protein J6C29_06275 [Clostridia bacterium]|nr:hypothetical protein [Clostridia bacterium]
METAIKCTKTKNKGFAGFILFLVAAICILGCSSATSKGAINGLKISSSVIIPALFPFTVCSVFFQKSGALFLVSNKIDKFTTLLFRLSGTEFSVILLSLLGGYPIGAKITDELLNCNALDKSAAKRLMRYSINPSPAFIISVVGINIFNSLSVGIILFVSNMLSCIILNCLLLPKNKSSDSHTLKLKNGGENISDAFVNSVLAGAKITINICSFVVLFSALSEILKLIPINSNIYSFICPFLEISFGINEVGRIGIPTYLYGFLLSFGGISTICQVKQTASSINPSFLYILLHRIIHGFVTLIFSLILFKLFPLNSTVFSSTAEIKFTEYPMFMPSIMLIIFSVLFLMFLSSDKSKQLS